jgi:hypothetical protein
MEHTDHEHDHVQEMKYTKGFNNGYLMAKHQPELLKKIVDSLQLDEANFKALAFDQPYFDGLVSGKQEYEVEKAQSYFKRFDKSDALGKDKGKEKGGPEITR